MSFEIPTPQEVRDQNYSNIEADLPNVDPRLNNSFINAIAKMDALAVHGLYLYLQRLKDQIFVESSDAEFLEKHGSPLGIDRQEATKAGGTVTATGTNGTSIPAATLLQRSDGSQYTVTVGVTIATGTADMVVQAVDFGSIGNADASSSLSFVSPIAGVDSTATVDGDAIIGGEDVETDEDYRQRILDRKRQPPQGGAENDYIVWAKEVANVTRAWAYGNLDGLGTVRVLFMTDTVTADGIPIAAKVTEVDDYISDSSRKPITADLTVLAPTAQPIAFDITITPDTADIRTAVTEELKDLLLRSAEPDGTILISKIREAVSTATGETDNVVNLPAANVTATSDVHIHTFGSIVFS